MNHSWSTVVRTFLVGAVIHISAFGQLLVEPDRVASVRQLFQAAESRPQLRCEIHPMRPAMDFALRFETGYSVDIPLAQFRGSGHGLNMLVRVTPSGRGPVYLAQTGGLPEVPKTKADGVAGGTFVVGEGTYDVALLMEDGLHRSCRGAWQIQARRTGCERQLKPATPAGAVEERPANGPPLAATKSSPRLARLTILLHAAPLSPNLSKLQPEDIRLLLDSLSSLLRELPARSVRLVAFNLDQRAVVFRKDGFESSHLSDLAAALSGMKLGLVDYRTLQQGREPMDLLLELMQAELRNPKSPDAVILLGPRTRIQNNLPADSASKRQSSAPPIFALQCRIDQPLQAGRSNRPLRRSQGMFSAENSDLPNDETDAGGTLPEGPAFPELAEEPDSIQRLIRRLKGETIPVRTPHDLADAIRRIDSRIPKTAELAEPPAKELADSDPEHNVVQVFNQDEDH